MGATAGPCYLGAAIAGDRMAEWVTCGACGLRHSRRDDGKCPRCTTAGGAVASPPRRGGRQVTLPRWSAWVLIAQATVEILGHLWVALAALDRDSFTFTLFSGWGENPVGPVVFAELSVILGFLPWLLWLVFVARALRQAGVKRVPTTWVIVLTYLVPFVNVGAHAWVLVRLWRGVAEAGIDRDPAGAGLEQLMIGTWVIAAVTALFYPYTSPLLCRVPGMLTFGYMGSLDISSRFRDGGLIALLRVGMALACAGSIAVVVLFQERLRRAAGVGAVAAAARRPAA